MPLALERKLKKRARALGYKPGSERYNAYVYGTLRRAGWKPATEEQVMESDYDYNGANLAKAMKKAHRDGDYPSHMTAAHYAAQAALSLPKDTENGEAIKTYLMHIHSSYTASAQALRSGKPEDHVKAIKFHKGASESAKAAGLKEGNILAIHGNRIHFHRDLLGGTKESLMSTKSTILSPAMVLEASRTPHAAARAASESADACQQIREGGEPLEESLKGISPDAQDDIREMTKLSSKHSRTASEVERENGVPGGAEASYHSYAAMAHGLTARASIAHHRGRTASATTLAKRAHSYHTEALKFIGRARLKPDVESGLRNNHKIGMGVLHHIMHSTQESFSESGEPHLTDKTILFESTFRVAPKS